MVVVIFEFEADPTRQDRYFELATVLRDEVEKIEGFVSVERFENIHEPGCFVSISTWERHGSSQSVERARRAFFRPARGQIDGHFQALPNSGRRSCP